MDLMTWTLVQTGLVSMWPLLKKDGLALQYIAVTLLWNCAIGYNPFGVNSGRIVRALSLVCADATWFLCLLSSSIS
jgi:alpha-1,3-glucosyltransferase